jgi:hypothetical protein
MKHNASNANEIPSLRKHEASSTKLNQLIPRGALADIWPFPERLVDGEGQHAVFSNCIHRCFEASVWRETSSYFFVIDSLPSSNRENFIYSKL